MSLSNCSALPINKILDEEFKNPLEEKERLTFIAFYCAISTISAMANVWSLAALPARAYKIPYKFCLASLSMSDFFYGVLVSIDNAMRLETNTLAWVLNDSLCSIIPFLTTACVLNSSLTISCVALDRYLALTSMREKCKPGLLGSSILTLLLWVFSLGISVPIYLEYTPATFCIVTVTPTTLVCSSCAVVCMNERNIIWYSVIYGAIFLPIVIVLLFSYSQIALYALQTRFRSQRPSPSTTDVTESVPTSVAGFARVPRKASARKKIRTLKIVLAIIVIFIIGRLPQFTLNFISTVNSSIGGHALFICRYVFSILGVANSAINPFLYSFLDDVLDFKRKLGYKMGNCMKYVTDCFRRKSNKGVYSVNQ